jgi:hypothetical protein
VADKPVFLKMFLVFDEAWGVPTGGGDFGNCLDCVESLCELVLVVLAPGALRRKLAVTGELS